jgi:hypothetical protein
MMVAHACNLADQENHRPKSAQAKQLKRHYLKKKKKSQTQGLVQWLKV